MVPMKRPAKRHRRESPVRWDELPEPIIQNIQSYLDTRDVLCTSVVSKAWRNAWFTIPFLRFKEFTFRHPETESDREIKSSKFRKLVDDTVARYARNNMLIETVDISIDNVDQEMISLCKNWIEEVLAAGKGLTKISVFGEATFSSNEPLLSFPLSPMIECRSLLVLCLYYVCIDEQVIHELLSTCLLLEEVSLCCCNGFEKIEVKDLHRLHVFDISLSLGTEIVQIDNCPSLQKLSYGSALLEKPALALKIDASENLKSLQLENVAIGDKHFNQFIAKFPVLECLAIIGNNLLEKINIGCDSLKRLKLGLCKKLMHVEVHSATLRELRFHHFYGGSLPTFSFPNLTHNQMDAALDVSCPFDNSSCLLMLREVVKVSNKLDIAFTNCTKLKVDLDYWRRIRPSSKSMDELVIRVSSTPAIRVSSTAGIYFSTIIDALFSICHPKYVCARWNDSEGNAFRKFLLRELMERANSRCCISLNQIKCWRHYLKDVEIGLPRKGYSTPQVNMSEMEPLKFPWRCILDGSKRPRDDFIFKLIWSASV